ncbi:MAG TPA: hypothetical protein ENN80_01550, partial [Candidatus Hydrogenedentes bacterium]|nr:hypothetical protein [Candidatus Hydrogenedentota bacterium]
NLLEEGIEEVFAQEIRGNFGMHQRALAYAVAARQYGKVDEWLDGIFTYSGPAYTQTGLNYALYDLVFRDGLPFETSPGYNWGWVANITTVAETLKRAGRDVYAIPKMKRLYDGVLDMHAARAFTPALGDSGNVYGGMIGCDGRVFQAAYRAYRDPRFYRHLAAIDATGDASFVSYESLFHPAVEAGAAEFPAQASRLLDGYGMAILNNPADSIAATLYYGFKGGHGHFDRLHFDIFANGRPMLPDLGYPDFMNVYVSGIYTWSQNTINHNTVTVDARRQSSNLAGSVRAFAVGAFARVVDIDAPGTYAQCTTYRRRLFMIDRDASRSYFIDVFTVDGGRQHDYSLHGPPGAFEVLGGEWLAQEQGTLAGEDVPLGVIYDNAKLGAEGYDGAYSGYAGSGFQHLYNVRRLAQGDWVAQWTHEKDPEARLRIRTLGQPGQQIILANAQVSPVKHKQVLTYLIARCQGDEPMSSRFVSVIEPYAGAPFIQRAELLPVAEEGLAVRVTFDDGAQDIVLCEAAGVEKPETDAAYAVLRTDPEGAATDAFMAYGTHLDGNGIRLGAGPTTGTVVSVKPCFEGPPAPPEINVKLDGAPPALEQAAIAHFSNALRQTVHPIARASQRDGLYVLETADDVLVGRARITGIEADALLTDTVLHFASLYAGAYAADEAFSSFRVIEKVKGGRIQLAEPLPEGQPFVTGRDVWIVNVGPGDRLDIPATAEYTSLKKQEGATP